MLGRKTQQARGRSGSYGVCPTDARDRRVYRMRSSATVAAAVADAFEIPYSSADNRARTLAHHAARTGSAEGAMDAIDLARSWA